MAQEQPPHVPLSTLVIGEVTIVENEVKKYWEELGPGLTTGAADDDPSGIATYSQAGAQFGFQLIWLSLWTLPLMAVIQEMCARMGIVTGRGLASNIRLHYSRPVILICVFLLFVANTFNIAADIGAMAKGVQLLVPQISFIIAVLFFAISSLLLQIYTSYKTYSEYLKYLTLVLFAYIATGLMIHFDWYQLFHYLIIPQISFSKDQIFLICAVLGTTISPYLFFWQSSQEVEDQILKGIPVAHDSKYMPDDSHLGATNEQIKNMRVDVWSGMTVSNIVMFFIIAVCSATLFSHGITTIGSAADAALALRPFAGQYAYLFFAIGIIGTGLLAIPVLAGSSAYAVAETFRWKEGLYNKLHEAYAFYSIIIVSMILALIFNFIGLDPIKVLIYSAVLNGIIAPLMLFFIVHLSSNFNVMGDRVNRQVTTFFGWVIIILMSIVGLATIYTLF